jgi:flagellar motility protein MotE (MotC chaperone)
MSSLFSGKINKNLISSENNIKSIKSKIENELKEKFQELEKKNELIEKQNNDRCINLYGGMGLDSVPNDIKLLRLEELKYMSENLQLYQYKQKDDNI